MGLRRLIEESPKTGPDTTVAEAARIMSQGNVGSMAVVEGKRIVGIFTERDLMRRVVVEGLDPAATALRDVMTSPVYSVTDETSIQEATRLMRQHHMRHLPVVDDNGDYVGMLALRYLHNEIMLGLERRVHDLTTWLMDDSLGG